MPRSLKYPEQLSVNLPEGTLGRIDGVASTWAGETRQDFARRAIEVEIERRTAEKDKPAS